jgi:Putative Flp pilus-assembly TadE/G-like
MSLMQGRERGQVLVLTALFLVVLLLAGALAMDYSSWLVARRDYQAVVDAAALAGAAQLPPPGVAASSTEWQADQNNAAVEALVYLSDHLGFPVTRSAAAANVSSFLNNPAPYVPTGSGYCVWIWTPVPLSTVSASADSQCAPSSSTLYSPATFAGDQRKVFVRVQSLRPALLGGVAGIQNELVSAIAVAGGARNNWAVIALKPRLNTPDQYYGVNIMGSSTLTIPDGDVGGNYTLAWGGQYSHVVFPAGTDQEVALAEPQTVQGVGSVLNGLGIQQLLDNPIPDPAYGTPSMCSGSLTSPCWPEYPPSTGGATNKGVYPACATAQDINKHSINCANGSSITIYPGRYEQVKIPSGTTVTLSKDCYPGDTACTSENRAGVFYFALDNLSNGGGLYLNGTSGQPTVLTGCGVLLIFDPNESGGSGIQMNVAGYGNTININSTSCGMLSSPPHPGGGTTPYPWYGYGAADFTNPISVWVRPNLSGYNVTTPNSGSRVITMGAHATINENGVVYAPQDNTTIFGGPSGSGVGQIVAWTITYDGGTSVTESFQGPALIRTRLYQ